MSAKDLVKKTLAKTGFELHRTNQGQWKSFYEMNHTVVDVLFVNGCDPSVPHPARYRVTHQIEQLNAHGISTRELFYDGIDPLEARYASMIVIFRCPYVDEVGQLIENAKSFGVPVFFDIDDLVIDTVYTDTNPYVQELKGSERQLYDNGVKRMGKTLSLCDGAITTTKTLADELLKYVPEVIINRNVASEEMYGDSIKALSNVKREDDEIRLGYFSGSITHNDDFKLIMPAIISLFKKHENLRLYLIGELDIPGELEPFKDKIITHPFMDYHKLPELIASVDINLAPLTDNIFNEAKSENKWVEAALVNVATAASKRGAFLEMISEGETGLLVEDDEWESKLEFLIDQTEIRNTLARNANAFVLNNCLTSVSGDAIVEKAKSVIEKSVLLLLPSTEISGGIMVALRHAAYLREAGFVIHIHASNPSFAMVEFGGEKYPVTSWQESVLKARYKKAIATLWNTAEVMNEYANIEEKYYLVQGFERDLYEPGSPLRIMANATYHFGNDINYVTISRWCQGWLKDRFEKDAKYAPNGIEASNFNVADRDWSGKIKILIEGDCAVSYKGIDESFAIVDKLDPDKFEIYYMSYNGQPKDNYKIDKFLHRIPYDKVHEVYEDCHILLKSSYLESFSYPPLEMMATGGYVVALPNGGNVEYLEDERNCLFYKKGDTEGAADAIRRIAEDEGLRTRLCADYRNLVSGRDWNNIKGEILALYNVY